MSRIRPITSRQAEVFTFVAGFIRKNRIAPTIREIGAEFKITPRAVYDHLRALERKGYLSFYKSKTSEHTARNIQVTSDLTALSVAENH